METQDYTELCLPDYSIVKSMQQIQPKAVVFGQIVEGEEVRVCRDVGAKGIPNTNGMTGAASLWQHVSRVPYIYSGATSDVCMCMCMCMLHAWAMSAWHI